MSENGSYDVGYGKPPVKRQFGKPEGNPNGKTSETRRMEIQNAELAMQIRNRLLTALHGVMNENPTKEDIVNEHIRNEVLKLLKDSEDRGLGSPVQDIRSGDGSMSPKEPRELSDDELAKIVAAAHGKPS